MVIQSRNMLTYMILCAFVAATTADYNEGSVYMRDGKTTFKAGAMDKSAMAYGFYNNTLTHTGWGVLEIRAGYGGLEKNNDILYAAGYLEGALTAKQIWEHYQNMKPVFIPSDDKNNREEKLKEFFGEQEAWTQKMIRTNPSDKFWRHVSYVASQLDGLAAGYYSEAIKHSDWNYNRFVVQFLNAVGDLIDLIKVIDASSTPVYDNMRKEELLNFVSLQGHCSALVKTPGAFEDLFMSHSSWFVYSATNRIYKHYHFNVNDQMASKDTSFSSYPGFLESLDDFYILGSGMVLLQTTNNVFDASLYANVTAASLLAWQRVRVANAIAASGGQWADAFARYNSGTYNNQYMVVDLKKIHVGAAILDDALWVVEQIPSLVKSGDQTDILRAGYWPSYNVPFYEEIYDMSGYPDFVAKHGLDYSYQLAPRAKIFRRDQAQVKDMDSMKHIMRYNDYTHDPYSEGNSCNTICCRGDLVNDGPRASGCYDTKVTDFAMAQKMQAWVINGPTLGDDLPPFSWTGRFANVSHVGLPEKYAFGWYLMEPVL